MHMRARHDACPVSPARIRCPPSMEHPGSKEVRALTSMLVRAASRLRGAAPRGAAGTDARALWGSAATRILLDGTQVKAAAFDELTLTELRSHADCRRFYDDNGPVFRKRRAVERMLAAAQEPFKVPGYNALIGKHVDFD